MSAARRTFAQMGYDSTSNKDIAREAEITTGAIYYYFGSKADLYAAVFEDVQTIIYTRFEDVRANAPVDFTAQIEAVISSAVAINREDPSIAAFVVNVPIEVKRHPELAEPVDAYRRSQSFIHDLVYAAKARGELNPDLHPDTIVDLLTLTFAGLARFSYETGDSDRHERSASALFALLEGRLLRKAEPPKKKPQKR